MATFRAANLTDLALIRAEVGDSCYVASLGRMVFACPGSAIGSLVTSTVSDIDPIGWVDDPSAGTTITLAPSGGIDDWGGANGLVALVAAEYGPGGKRRKIVLLPGNYKAGTNFVMPPGLQLECMPGVDIECTYTPRVGPPAPYVGPFVSDLVYTGFTATLTADAVVGSRTFLLTSAPVVGKTLLVWRNGVGFPAEPFEVVKVTGSSSPYTVQVDHEITYAWPSATTTTAQTTPNKGIHLSFNGATIHGPSERLLSIANAVDCVMEGYDCDASECTEFPLSIDTGSMRSQFRHGFVRNSVGICGYLESGYKNQIIDTHGVNAVQGFGCWGVNQRIIGCTATGQRKDTGLATWAYNIGHPGSSLDDGQTNGCRIEKCEGSGFRYGVVAYGTKDCVIANCNLNDLDQGVVGITTGGSDLKKAVNLRLENVKINGTVRHGIYNEAGHDMVVVDCEVRNSTMIALYNYTAATMKVVGGYFQCTTADRAIENNGTMWLSNWPTVDGATRAPSGTYLVVNNLGDLYVDTLRWIGVPVDSGGNFTVLAIGPRTITGLIERVSGLASYLIAKSGASSIWHRKQPLNMAGVGTLSSGTGQSSAGTLTLTGTTPVAVSFTDIKAGNLVILSSKAITGTVGNRSYTITPGTGFSAVSTGTETSTVDYQIL